MCWELVARQADEQASQCDRVLHWSEGTLGDLCVKTVRDRLSNELSTFLFGFSPLLPLRSRNAPAQMGIVHGVKLLLALPGLFGGKAVAVEVGEHWIWCKWVGSPLKITMALSFHNVNGIFYPYASPPSSSPSPHSTPLQQLPPQLFQAPPQVLRALDPATFPNQMPLTCCDSATVKPTINI